MTDPKDPKILEYKKRMELYEISKNEVYPRIKYGWNLGINGLNAEIKKLEGYIQQLPTLFPNDPKTKLEIENFKKEINKNKELIKTYTKLAYESTYDDFINSGFNLDKPKDVYGSVGYQTTRKGTNYKQPTFSQEKLIKLGVEKYKIYPDYEYDRGETDNRPLLYKKPTLEFIYADPKNFKWNQPKVIKWACPSTKGGGCVQDNNGKFNSKEECENTPKSKGGCKVEIIQRPVTDKIIPPKQELLKFSNNREIIKNKNATNESEELEINCDFNDQFQGVQSDPSKNYVGLEYNTTIVANVGDVMTITFNPYRIPDAFYVKYGDEEFFSGFIGQSLFDGKRDFQKQLNNIKDLKTYIQNAIDIVGGITEVSNKNLNIKTTRSWSITINVKEYTNLKILAFSPLEDTHFNISTSCGK